jgi:hypothetical protein
MASNGLVGAVARSSRSLADPFLYAKKQDEAKSVAEGK